MFYIDFEIDQGYFPSDFTLPEREYILSAGQIKHKWMLNDEVVNKTTKRLYMPNLSSKNIDLSKGGDLTKGIAQLFTKIAGPQKKEVQEVQATPRLDE
jgi:hypothetical protein